MIRVIYSELDGPEGLTLRLEASGHAGYAPAGQDIVCAGASTLMQALVSLLAGEKTAEDAFQKKPEGTIPDDAAVSAFSFEERKAYFKRKWRKEHISLFIVLGSILIAALVLPFAVNKPWLLGMLPLIALLEYGYQNSRMMTYLENALFH